jgi:hypothetical protein
MGASQREPKAGLVALTASTVVLVAGVAAVAWFVEVRGAGVGAMLAGPQALDLAIVVGVTIALSVAAHFVVANGLRAAAGGGERVLLRRALEIDVTDPDVVREFESLPELRELVATLVTEKAHVRDLSDRLEAVRGEIDAVTEGMRRSTTSLSRLREEGASALGVQIAVLWNGLVERVRHAEEQVAQAAERGASASAADGDLEALVSRLDELESDLARLRTALAAPTRDAGIEVEAETWSVPDPSRSPVPHVAPASLFIEEDADAPVVGMQPVAPGDIEFVTRGSETPAYDALPAESAPSMRNPAAVGLGTPGAAASGRQATPVAVPVHAGTNVPALARAAASEPAFEEMPFPRFVGRSQPSPSDRVEVTYEQAAEDAVELPASALFFESEPESEPASDEKVLDLRSLGAREFEA